MFLKLTVIICIYLFSGEQTVAAAKIIFRDEIDTLIIYPGNLNIRYNLLPERQG